MGPLTGHTMSILFFLSLSGIFVPSTLGNPFTKLQFVQLKHMLEEKIQEPYPSDDKDYFADLLIQEPVQARNITVYHGGDVNCPVFISYGLGNVGKKTHVLLRGEDYLNPKNRNDFVVLKQTGSPEKYSVHLAHITNMANLKKSKVVWNDGRVEQQKRLGKLLQRLGNPEVQARSMRSKRPRCDWLGFTLLCDSKKNVKPMRKRAPRKPLDEIDSSPPKPPPISDEAGGAAEPPAKPKRQIVTPSRQPPKKAVASTSPAPVNPKAADAYAPADIGDGISEEDRAIVFKTEEKPAAPAPSTSEKAGTYTDTSDNGGSGILIPISKAPAAKPEPDEEKTTKKKHKKKHKKSKKGGD